MPFVTIVTIETVTMRIPSKNTTSKPDTTVKAKPHRTIFVKKIDTKETKAKTSPTMSTIRTSVVKVKSNTTNRSDKIITVGQVFLKHKEGNRQPQQTKGKTTVMKVGLDKRPQTDVKLRTVENKESTLKEKNLKDEPVYQKNNGTSNVLNRVKETKGSSNETTSRTKATVDDQGKASMPNGISTEKDKKPIHGNVTTVLKLEKKRFEKHVNWTSIETKLHTKNLNSTTIRSLVIGSVDVHNITSTGFIMSWEAPLDAFKNFTITRREVKPENDVEDNKDAGKVNDKWAEDVTDLFQRSRSNRTIAKVHGSKLKGRPGNKFSQVLAGTAQSYHFKGLQPQTQYSVSLFGSGPGVRSKIHRLALYTGRFFYTSCFHASRKRGFLSCCVLAALKMLISLYECMKYLIVHLKY